MNIPIYRAKKKYSGGYIEGYLVKNTLESSDRVFIINWFMPDTINQDNGYVEIDPSTLAISFNGGITWRTIEEVMNGLTFLGDPTIQD